MTFYLTCLLCDQGNNPKTSPNLVTMQEHLMNEHGYTREDLQKQTKQETDDGYIYTFADGKDWLHAIKGGNHVGGL